MLAVYRAAIEEYRFNVNLGWEWQKFFIGLIAAMLAAGIGLVRFAGDSVATATFLTVYFILVGYMTRHADATTRKSKTYYRNAIYKKTLIERELGLLSIIPGLSSQDANFSLAVTAGSQDFAAALRLRPSPEKADGAATRGSIVDQLERVVQIMRVMSWIGVLASLWSLVVALLSCSRCQT